MPAGADGKGKRFSNLNIGETSPLLGQEPAQRAFVTTDPNLALEAEHKGNGVIVTTPAALAKISQRSLFLKQLGIGVGALASTGSAIAAAVTSKKNAYIFIVIPLSPDLVIFLTAIAVAGALFTNYRGVQSRVNEETRWAPFKKAAGDSHGAAKAGRIFFMGSVGPIYSLGYAQV